MDLRSLPKAELHLHLEGSVEPATLREINPALSLAEIRANTTYSDFRGFLDAYKWVNFHLHTPAHFALITRRLLESLHTQGVVHAEINVSAGIMLLRKLDVDAIFSAIAAQAALSPLSTRFIFDAVRQFGLDHVRQTAQAAVRLMPLGVAAFGIGGDEATGPARPLREVLDYARSSGLALLPHAGETTGPDSIWAALEAGARRIGHGIRAIDDPVLLAHLRDHDIPLEISITSNLRTGAVASLKDHPIARLHHAGVPITLNTDDPALFETSLLAEYEIAARHFHLDPAALAANSLRYRLP